MQHKTILCFLAALGMAAGSCGHESHEGHEGHNHEAHEHADAHDHAAHMGHEGHEGHESHNHGAGHAKASADEIVLEPHAAARFGVAVDTVRRTDFSSVVRATGIVMPSAGENAVVAAPTSGMVHFARGIEAGAAVGRGAVVATIDARGVTGGDANASAKAQLAAARRELDRVQALYAERLATVGEYNAALAAYEQAEAGFSAGAASGRATSPIAGVVTTIDVQQGQYVATGEPLATVTSARNLTVRVDVPRREYQTASAATDAVLEMTELGSDAVTVSALGGKRISGSAPAGTGGYVPVYFSIPNNGRILAGSTLTAYLHCAPRTGVVTLPESAFSEQQGQFYVYERLDDECYAKRLVRTGASDGLRREIIAGIEPGAVVVTEGVTTVRLAETGAAIPEGHTHNH